MPIPDDQKPVADHAILRVLDNNRTPYGLSAEAIAIHARRFGVDLTEAEVIERLEYLTGKRMIVEALKELHRTDRAWRITGEGMDYLDRHGL